MTQIAITDRRIFQLIVTLLLDFSIVESSKKVAHQDILLIPASLLCWELAVISILHLYAFSFKSYRVPVATGTKKHIRTCCTAVADVLNPMDMIKAMIRGRSWRAIPTTAETEYDVQGTSNAEQRLSSKATRDTVSYVELMEWKPPVAGS
jgi:hypothetical protein